MRRKKAMNWDVTKNNLLVCQTDIGMGENNEKKKLQGEESNSI